MSLPSQGSWFYDVSPAPQLSPIRVYYPRVIPPQHYIQASAVLRAPFTTNSIVLCIYPQTATITKMYVSSSFLSVVAQISRRGIELAHTFTYIKRTFKKKIWTKTNYNAKMFWSNAILTLTFVLLDQFVVYAASASVVQTL